MRSPADLNPDGRALAIASGPAASCARYSSQISEERRRSASRLEPSAAAAPRMLSYRPI
jgi:hypothetical protein